jgi:hypothetical protein
MKTHYTVALAMFAGIAIGAVAVQSLHAQSKPKAYTVTEIEVIDAAAQAAYTPTIVAEIGFAGGRPVNNAGGKPHRRGTETRRDQRMGEPRQGAGILQLIGVEEARAAARQGAKDNPAIRRRKSELGLPLCSTVAPMAGNSNA